MRIVFMGSPEEVITPLAKLAHDGPSAGFHLIAVISQPAKPAGRKNLLQDPPVAAWAKKSGLLCLQPDSAKSPEFLAQLRGLNPNVIVTAAYGQILSDDFLKIPTRATINIHPSALPRFRGATPVPAALLDGLSATAVTILFTVRKLDAGNIIVSEEFEILREETAGKLTERLFSESANLLFKALERLKEPTFVGVPQDESCATFCKKIDKEDGLISWDSSCSTIMNRFRAYEPWPGSWTFLADKRFAIISMEHHPMLRFAGPNGSFRWDKPSKSLLVAASDGVISLKELKPAGGKVIDSASFWNGLRDKSNLQFRGEPSLP